MGTHLVLYSTVMPALTHPPAKSEPTRGPTIQIQPHLKSHHSPTTHFHHIRHLPSPTHIPAAKTTTSSQPPTARGMLLFSRLLPRTAHLRAVRAMSSSGPSSSSASPDSQTPSSTTPADSAPLGLPTPGENSGVTNISVNGPAVKLDHLGPLVVNTDGTMSRITNWSGMTDGEKESTLRILGRRNKQRLEALRKAEAEAEKGQGSE